MYWELKIDLEHGPKTDHFLASFPEEPRPQSPVKSLYTNDGEKRFDHSGEPIADPKKWLKDGIDRIMPALQTDTSEADSESREAGEPPKTAIDRMRGATFLARFPDEPHRQAQHCRTTALYLDEAGFFIMQHAAPSARIDPTYTHPIEDPKGWVNEQIKRIETSLS